MSKKTPPKEVLAVIDVGGSSISLEFRWKEAPLLKDDDGLPKKIKKFCRLSQSIGDTDNICDEGRDCALDTLQEIQKEIKALRKKGYTVTVKAIGTAPFRDAENGEEVAKELRKKTGIDLETITGEQEALYVGLGALANLGDAAHDFFGIVIDTGGGSSEFALIENGIIKKVASLPVGNVRLQSLDSTEAKQNFIKEHIAKLPAAFKRDDLPVILSGGGNRALIKAYRKVYRQESDAPTEREMASMCEIFSYAQGLAFASVANKQDDIDAEKERTKKLSEILGVKAERIDILPEISLLIEALRSQLGYQKVRLLKSSTRDGVRTAMINGEFNTPEIPENAAPEEDAPIAAVA